MRRDLANRASPVNRALMKRHFGISDFDVPLISNFRKIGPAIDIIRYYRSPFQIISSMHPFLYLRFVRMGARLSTNVRNLVFHAIYISFGSLSQEYRPNIRRK